MLHFVVAMTSYPAQRLQGPEPGVAVVGIGMLCTAWVLPGLWAHGVNPIPPCIFHTVTGLPCPFCGGTRSFAAMAHGNIAGAAHVFPIGPLLFVALVAAVIYSTWAVVTGRRLHLTMDRKLVRILTAVGLLVLATNWASKLFILGY
jgi:hypothetical protein